MRLRQYLNEKTYDFKSNILRVAVEKANSNGAGIVNDGNRYIIAAFDYAIGLNQPKTRAISTTKNKSTVNVLVKQFMKDEQADRIFVQKGDKIIIFTRKESGGWHKKGDY